VLVKLGRYYILQSIRHSYIRCDIILDHFEHRSFSFTCALGSLNRFHRQYSSISKTVRTSRWRSYNFDQQIYSFLKLESLPASSSLLICFRASKHCIRNSHNDRSHQRFDESIRHTDPSVFFLRWRRGRIHAEA